MGKLQSLYIDPFVRVPLHIPAGNVAEMGKQGANARLIFGLGKIVLGSAILFVNRIVGLDGHGRKGIAVIRNFVAEREIISHIHQRYQENQYTNNSEDRSFQLFPSFRIPFLTLLHFNRNYIPVSLPGGAVVHSDRLIVPGARKIVRSNHHHMLPVLHLQFPGLRFRDQSE